MRRLGITDQGGQYRLPVPLPAASGVYCDIGDLPLVHRYHHATVCDNALPPAGRDAPGAEEPDTDPVRAKQLQAMGAPRLPEAQLLQRGASLQVSRYFLHPLRTQARSPCRALRRGSVFRAFRVLPILPVVSTVAVVPFLFRHISYPPFPLFSGWLAVSEAVSVVSPPNIS